MKSEFVNQVRRNLTTTSQAYFKILFTKTLQLSQSIQSSLNSLGYVWLDQSISYIPALLRDHFVYILPLKRLIQNSNMTKDNDVNYLTYNSHLELNNSYMELKPKLSFEIGQSSEKYPLLTCDYFIKDINRSTLCQCFWF